MIGVGNDCLRPMYLPIPGYEEKLRVKCGKCDNCKAARAREWSLRLEMESKYWKDLCFVTLTYNNDSLPLNIVDGHLFYSDEEIAIDPELAYLFCPTHRPEHLCLFLKRLRKRYPSKIRYFAVGEYGTRYGRSHIHIIFFGIPFTEDAVHLIEKCWPYGFVKVTPFFPETCAYVAGYVQKKLYGDNKRKFRMPEFMRCSQHLGERWLLDHISLFDDEHPYIVQGKYKYALPRQFRKILVKKGRLSESSLIKTALLQLDEYKDLCKTLDSRGTTLSEFFSHRILTAQMKRKRKLSSRNSTGDI